MVALGRRTREKRRRFVLALGVFTLLFLIAYRFALSREPSYFFEFWNELPLHPCNLMVFLGIAAAAADRRLLQNFCFLAGTLSVLAALAAPLSSFSGISLLSSMGIGYYGFHGLALLLCLNFPVLGLTRPELRDLPPVLALSALLTGAAHLLNLLLRATVCPQANYFFTFGVPDNPLLGPLRAAIPVDLLFLLPLVAVLALWSLALVGLCRLSEKLAARLRKNKTSAIVS